MTTTTDFDDIFIKWLEKFNTLFHNTLHKIMDSVKECIENNYEEDECTKKTCYLIAVELDKFCTYEKIIMNDVDNVACFCITYTTHSYNSKFNRNELVYGKPPLEIAKKQILNAWGNND